MVRWVAIAAVAVAALGLGLGSCTMLPTSCRGLARDAPPFAPEDAGLARLQCAADTGMTAAQVALAKRYETGDGVPRDIARAVALYERAATAVPPTIAVYSPPVRLGGSGQVLLLPNSNARPGSAEAQYRLGRLYLEGRGVDRDPKRGRDLIARAAAQNYAPAIAEMRAGAEYRPAQ